MVLQVVRTSAYLYDADFLGAVLIEQLVHGYSPEKIRKKTPAMV
jgi:hypothetical protein